MLFTDRENAVSHEVLVYDYIGPTICGGGGELQFSLSVSVLLNDRSNITSISNKQKGYKYMYQIKTLQCNIYIFFFYKNTYAYTGMPNHS